MSPVHSAPSPPPPPPRPRKPKRRTKAPAPPPLTPAERAAAEAHLATQRFASQSRLKDAWESIFERYSQDFDGVADEIDTLTGEVVVDNGHLRGLGSGDGGGGEGFDWEGIVNLQQAGRGQEEGEWVDEECLECKERDELDDSFCRSCGGGGGGIFSTPFGASIVTPAKTPRSSPPETVPLPPALPEVKAPDPKDWLVEDVSGWMCALIELSPDEAVDLRKRVVGGGITGGHLLGGLRFEDLKEILGIASFSKRMELWNEVLKLRGAFTPGGGGITESSPCLPMPVPIVDSLEGDIDADTPTHTGRGKQLAKGGKGKKKVVVVGLASPRMASAGTSDTPKQRWKGSGEGASPGLGSLDRTPDTTSTTIMTATPTRSIKHKGKVKRLPSPTTSIAGTPRPTVKQQQQPEAERQESPDIITTSTPAPATTTTTKMPEQKAKSKAKVSTPSVPTVVKTPLTRGTSTSNTNPWAPPPPASDPFYSPMWNDEHPDGTPAKFHSSSMRLPLPASSPPKPRPTPAPTTKHEVKKRGRSVSTIPAATANITTTRSNPTPTIAKPQPFLTPAPPKRKRRLSAASATVGWTTDAKKRQRLSGKSFLKFGGGEDDDNLSSGGSSPVERGGLRQKKGFIVSGESAEVGTAEKVHKCCGRGFCFGCLDLEGEEDDLV